MLKTIPAIGAAFTLTMAAALPAAAADLALRRVVLSTAGLAYFEHEAEVDGEAELPLSVRLDQVDDVLKSAMVYDDRGSVGIVRLPGREPLDEAFRTLPFGRDALSSPVALLDALRGASVTISGARTIEGRLLGVQAEEERLPQGGIVTRHRVSVATADGLRQAVLEDLDAVSFTEPKLQAQIEAALAAVASFRDKDTRTLQIALAGSGRRKVRVGYVVEAPIWKTAYRLSVSGEAAGHLQGWAVLENLSGADWKDVDLTLVSGQPVAFRQAIYTAFFQPRPEVPVETVGRVLPRPDEGTFAKADLAPPPPPPPAPMMAPPAGAAPQMERSRAFSVAAPVPVPSQPATVAAPVVAEDAVARVLFRYPRPVTVAAGQSAMVPIVDRMVPVTQVALYQPGVEASHPFAAVALTNDSGATLPPGILTLYERGRDGLSGHVGDARLATLPVGEKRMLAFAVDRGIAIAREEQRRQTATSARIAGGVMTVSIVDRQTTTYRIRATKGEERSLVIEHLRPIDWELVTPPPAGIELAREAWRIPVRIGADGSQVVPVTTQRPRQTVVRLDNARDAEIGVYVSAPDLDPKVRDALKRVVELREALAAIVQRTKAIEQERKTAGEEQERIRANLQAVPARDAMHTRYLGALKTQEDRLDRLATDLQAARDAERAAREGLSAYIAGLDL
ncbi:uncharacterized protein DUF4139 [Stella humosa]|uniref:Uncharacterized protein DUF4139 n=2 Tax=Stella humosa TaxID=94 RepID=A0A3N1KHZ8_9PROT|nr:DUF4139 domain-containing protein [Stella humosa]ROP81193.1 uncharacterized protein DUF4139 [Stella humosa]